MKFKSIVFFTALSLAGAVTAAPAQRYAVAWHRVADGDGTSTNVQYTISGTIGQWEADRPLTSATYSVTGGFWQIPGGPHLTIKFLGPTQLQISWPTPPLGCFTLQETTSLVAPNWASVANVVTYANGINEVVIPISNNARFFRLISTCQ